MGTDVAGSGRGPGSGVPARAPYGGVIHVPGTTAANTC